MDNTQWYPLRSTSGGKNFAAYVEGNMLLKFTDKDRESVYQYDAVPIELFHSLLASPSGRAFLHEKIKNKFASHVVSGGSVRQPKRAA